MKLPVSLEKGFRDDLAGAIGPRRRKTVIKIWTATIRDEMGAAWGGQIERDIRAELERIEKEAT